MESTVLSRAPQYASSLKPSRNRRLDALYARCRGWKCLWRKNRVPRNDWHNDLRHVLPNLYGDTVLYMNPGMHFLFNHYNIEASVDLLLRMLCQASLLFWGKILLLNAAPVQQQMYPKIDFTNSQVRVLIAKVRIRLEKHNFKLQAICRQLPHKDLLSLNAAERSSIVSLSSRRRGRTATKFTRMPRSACLILPFIIC